MRVGNVVGSRGTTGRSGGRVKVDATRDTRRYNRRYYEHRDDYHHISPVYDDEHCFRERAELTKILELVLVSGEQRNGQNCHRIILIALLIINMIS